MYRAIGELRALATGLRTQCPEVVAAIENAEYSGVMYVKVLGGDLVAVEAVALGALP